MRILRVILILAVIVGFPAFSWYYLRSGQKWRVTAQNETQKKERFTDFALRLSDQSIMPSRELVGRYYVVAIPLDSTALRHLAMVHTQFHAREDFRMICLACGIGDVLAPEGEAWIHAQCTSGCEPVYGTWFGGGYDAAIVDDSLYVRGRYQLNKTEDMRKLVEHLAVVLPIDKRERIELKRGEHSR